MEKVALVLLAYILFVFAKRIYKIIKEFKTEKPTIDIISTLILCTSTWYVFLIFFQTELGFNWFFNKYLLLLSIILIAISGLILIFFPKKKIV
ncbi:MAG: hypothetical protein WCO35_01420 [Candidatus Nomurabacteria bacterium]